MPDPTPQHRLHLATILLKAIFYLRQLVVALFALIASLVSHRDSDVLAHGIGFAILAGVAGLTLLPALIHFLMFRYGIVGDAFVVQEGLFVKKTRTIPLERIQNINIKRTLLQRLLGVAAIHIETASGKGVEAELNVVSMAEAERLSVELQQIGKRTLPVELHDRDLVYHASFKQLLLAGATQNRAGTILVFLLGGLQYVDDLQRSTEIKAGHLARSVQEVHLEAMTWVLGAVLVVGAFLFVGWILSILGAVVGDFGFSLRSTEGVLKVNRGMFTQLQSVVPARRVQALRIEEPVLQRRLGYCQVYAESAGSFEDKSSGNSAKLCPLLPRRDLMALAALVFPSVELDNVPWIGVSPRAVPRIFLSWLGFWLFVLVPVAIFWHREVLYVLPVLAIYLWLVARASYQVHAFSEHDGFVYVRTGAWRRHVKAAPEDRIQAVSVSQTFFQKRLGLASLSMVTAGVTLHSHLHVGDLHESDAYAFQDRLMERPHRGPVGGV